MLAGLIYAVGGYDGNSRQCLSSVEVYNPDQDLWSPVSDMSARRSVYNITDLAHTALSSSPGPGRGWAC